MENLEEKNKDNFSLDREIKKIEAIFFIVGRFLNIKELIIMSDLNSAIIKNCIEILKKKYDKQNSAICIVEKGEAWKMDIRPEYSYLVNKLATGSSEFSKAEQETLAIIAFKQPVKQSIVIKIRGNKAYDHIKKFAELGLLKKKKLGHTYEIRLNDDFYDYFNISGESSSENQKDLDIINSEFKK